MLQTATAGPGPEPDPGIGGGNRDGGGLVNGSNLNPHSKPFAPRRHPSPSGAPSSSSDRGHCDASSSSVLSSGYSSSSVVSAEPQQPTPTPASAYPPPRSSAPPHPHYHQHGGGGHGHPHQPPHPHFGHPRRGPHHGHFHDDFPSSSSSSGGRSSHPHYPPPLPVPPPPPPAPAPHLSRPPMGNGYHPHHHNHHHHGNPPSSHYASVAAAANGGQGRGGEDLKPSPSENLGILKLPNLSVPNSQRKDGLLMDDDLGLRNLAQDLSNDTLRGKKARRFLSAEDLGFSEHVRRNFSPLYRHLESPFSDQLATPLSSCEVPEEYCNMKNIMDKLPKMLNHWPTDLLFFLFYTATGDQLQIWAGNLLHDKGWRYNKATGTWVARFPKQPPNVRTDTYEEGNYLCFDVARWERATRYLVLHYDNLAMKVPVPPSSSAAAASLGQGGNAGAADSSLPSSGGRNQVYDAAAAAAAKNTAKRIKTAVDEVGMGQRSSAGAGMPPGMPHQHLYQRYQAQGSLVGGGGGQFPARDAAEVEFQRYARNAALMYQGLAPAVDAQRG